MTDKTFVSVFRSSKKEDTYIFVRRGHDWSTLPEALREIFGEPVHSMDLVLTPERKLARATGQAVLEAIEDKDFYLQMPEELESYVVEFKEKLKDRR
ncbi:YcgL domain-containing protein [Marinobacter sp. CA1]|uniref:YcgL domain-containing protein n=1 Tax=Marinobacter sp. CA1 TaxID=2817656 RepID=UPI001D06AC15|nr:YcgL domain-containing protein [Marinobacter sp. CA1]MCG8517092.1 YcgL domain-containing protein [Pseudomonadales bacterium]UDL03303.1 YcgL domain-containing protein [Marinobacter sp. CA1]